MHKGMKSVRRYQRLLSKHRIKLNKYRVSGRIHRNGMGATFTVRWLVIASKSTLGHIASPIHNAQRALPGLAARTGVPPGRINDRNLMECHAIVPQSTIKSA